jgi:hypothetical protein
LTARASPSSSGAFAVVNLDVSMKQSPTASTCSMVNPLMSKSYGKAQIPSQYARIASVPLTGWAPGARITASAS